MFNLRRGTPLDDCLKHHLRYLMEEGSYADMKLLVENEKEIAIHKAVALSLIPNSVLSSCNTIRMTNISDKVGRAIAELIYIGSSEIENSNDLIMFKKVASTLKFIEKISIDESRPRIDIEIKEEIEDIVEPDSVELNIKEDLKDIKEEHLSNEETINQPKFSKNSISEEEIKDSDKHEEDPSDSIPSDVDESNDIEEDIIYKIFELDELKSTSFEDQDISDAENTCPDCVQTFESTEELGKHWMKVHDKRKFKCPECEKKYAYFADFQKHFQNDHPDSDIKNCGIDIKPFKCTICSVGKSSQIALKRHLDEHKNGRSRKKYVCDEENCDKTFSKKSSYQAHRNKVHNVALTIGKVHKRMNNSTYQKHIFRQNQDYSVECPICKGGFCSKYSMYSHVKACHKDVEFKQFKEEMDEKLKFNCKYCQEKFMKYEVWKDHEQIVHEKVDEKIVCGQCGKMFPTKFRMLRHAHAAHNSARSCNRGPEIRKLLHPENYFDMETKKCKLCDKIVNNGKLKKHYLTFHSENNERHNCPECPMSFVEKFKLTEHIKLKHEEWSDYCQLCSRKFPRYANKNIHMKKVHSLSLMKMCLGCRIILTLPKAVTHGHRCDGELKEILVRSP